MLPIARLAWFLGLALALAGSLRAQCIQMPNECCSDSNVAVVVMSVPGAMPMVLAVATQVSLAATNDSAQGPAASSLLDAGAPGFTTGSTCDIGPDVPAPDAGTGATVVSTHGAVRYHLPMPSVHTGLSGLAQLYPGVLVMDVSAGVYKSGTPGHLKGFSPNDPTGRLPVPDFNPELLDGGVSGLQPRPGTMPGLYVYQVGSTYYQYGGPLDTGADPQTTAVYADPTDSPLAEPLANNLSGALLYRFQTQSLVATVPVQNYLEIRHVDGTVARFDRFRFGWTQNGSAALPRWMFRLTQLRDPFDNLATFTYDGSNRLTRIDFPSGLSQHWNWNPNWQGFAGGNRLEITYQQPGLAVAELATRTWGLVFQPRTDAQGGNHFGGRLWRTYSALRSVLVDPVPGVPHTIGATSEVVGQIVNEWSFAPGGSGGADVLTQTQHVHAGQPFAGSLSAASGLPSQAVLETGTNPATGRIERLTRPLMAESLLFRYPAPTRTTDLLAEDVGNLRAIEVVDGAGTSRRYEYSVPTGRLYSVLTTPENTMLGRPREQHRAGENAGIGGVANSDVEPESIEAYNVYDATCVCKKPAKRLLLSKRGGTVHQRVTTFEYDPVSRLVTKVRMPNPETVQSGPTPAEVEYRYTYVQLNGGAGWGAWQPQTEVTPDGTWTYTYGDLLDRAPGHGQIARTVSRRMDQVRLQGALAGGATLSGSPVATTLWRNLPNLPPTLPMMGQVKGQPRMAVDGDGVATTYDYDARGHLTGVATGSALRTVYVPDAWGEVSSYTVQATSSSPAVTTVARMAGTGVPVAVVSASAGVPREARGFYDRFGHLAVVRRNNLSSSGAKPAAHGAGGGSARDWVETQYHFQHLRLMEVYEDRKPLDQGAGGGQFLVTRHDYHPDGRLQSIVHPNGSRTTYDFDGYGTLYRTTTVSPDGTQRVRGPKVFVTPFLEVSGSYEFTDVDHLWTLVARNAAGAIVAITEPATTPPAGYTPHAGADYATGGAVHAYQLDKLGRVVQVESRSGATLLARRRMAHDQLGRQIWEEVQVLGAGAGTLRTAWRYQPGKASQLAQVESTGRQPTSFVFNALGLLEKVRDGFGAGNTREFFYRANTQFLSRVRDEEIDGASGTTRVTEVAYDVNAFGQVTAIKHGVPHLLHSYAYNSLGNVDRYTDPMQRAQTFLPDALGRVVEHVRLGDGTSAIRTTSQFDDAGAPDGRTKVTRADALGNLTITHQDFAGRAFVVQNPGAGSTAPTPSSPHQSMSLFAQYDGASRLKSLFDGDGGRVDFWRDGRGRVIQRALVAAGPRISLWNTHDVIRRDALGRIQQTDYASGPQGSQLMGSEAFATDSAGRVHNERFAFAFAQANVLDVASNYAASGNGGGAFRTGLDYRDNLPSATAQPLQLQFGRDAIGRLTQIDWDRAPGSSPGLNQLARYEWAGGIRRSRQVRYGVGALPRGESRYEFDGWGRLTSIEDTIHKVNPPAVDATSAIASRFDYEYDAASNLTKERYAKVNAPAAVGDRFAYDAFDRLQTAWMGVTAPAMDGGQPPAFSPSTMHQRLTYGLDGANNRTTTTSQTGNAAPVTTTYTRQTSSPQGPSNRYESIAPSTSSTLEVRPEHDERGNLTYDGRFYFVYDAFNRLSEVWEVMPTDVLTSHQAVPNPAPTDEKYLPVEDESLEGAREAVKLDIPNLHSRLLREHRDPQFRNRLRAQVVGGVLRITPTPASGGGRPGWLPVPAEAQLRAVYVYDAFNRRTTTVLVGDSVRYYAWDGWRNVVEAEHVYDGASPATWQAAPLKQFVWGAELDELVSYRRKVPTTAGATAWETYFVLHGGQETAAKLVDAAGAVVEQYEYDPYGRATCFSKVAGVWTPAAESRFGLPFLWKGVRLDEVTGLLQMRNRYYSVETGRFLTRDPIGVWGDGLNLGNEYAYAASSPLCLNDHMGLTTGDPRFIGALDRTGWYCASDDEWRKERDRQIAEILAESAYQNVEDSRNDGKERGGILVLDENNRLYSIDAQTNGGGGPFSNFVDLWQPFREAVNMPDFEVVGDWHTHPKDPARPSTGDKLVHAGITGERYDGLPPPSPQSVDKKAGGPFLRIPSCSMFILGRPLGVDFSDKRVVVNSYPTGVSVPAK